MKIHWHPVFPTYVPPRGLPDHDNLRRWDALWRKIAATPSVFVERRYQRNPLQFRSFAWRAALFLCLAFWAAAGWFVWSLT
jgi:hypothetical protein